MVDKRIIFVLAAFMLIIVLVGCTRSLRPSSQVTEAVIEVSEEAPAGGTEVLSQIYMFATQTARADQGVIIEATAEPTGEISQPQDSEPVEEQETEPELSQAVNPTKAGPPPSTEKPEEYTLQKGEFAFCLARRFNVNPNELLRVNNIPPGTTLQPGTILILPKSDRTYPGDRALRDHPATYQVQEGDSIYSIACTFGDVDPNAIVYVNNLQEPYNLTTGQELQIP